ncbi:hypothetical protein GPECTOR_8g307 [Gonium pectorale]|uniref:Tyrosinase copper-binding domain-containing protein n=1 Tax=Gonium pectorale TaxID=33097 RepID=A0A150GSZ2_GONPE|nr:hypothetical protein GPECTOR_8g307 [Gonium pectorale]|eukprot:KXZ52931.1 hypothetical protein GPECTOR_8g307 [Gonium pectorale]
MDPARRAVANPKAVPTPAGKVIFGPLYQDYTEFVVRHSIAYHDPRGDQGHIGPCLMTFHRALMLEFENALLSVVPGLRAMPYWDFTLDRPGGRYFNTSQYIFTEKYAGKIGGDPEANYTVTTGAFGWRPVEKFQRRRFTQYESIYNGSRTTGLLRGWVNNVDNPYVTRFPWGTNRAYNATQMPWAVLSPAMVKVMKDASDANTLYNFTKADYDRCLNASAIKSINQWNYCADLSTVPTAPNPMEALGFANQFGISPLMHASAHFATGGFLDSIMDGGDLSDTSTSPNDILLFMAQHANIDRNVLMWQANLQASDPKVADKGVMWGYPATKAQYPTIVEGCLLHDPINSAAKFTELIPGRSKANGYTHFDVLDLTRPDNIPYTYDNVYGALKTKFKH